MGKFYESIPESFIPWINEQHCFWVATAPLSADGHVNVSPKGMTGTFKLLGPNSCFYQDLSGSGVETISHLRENGRITVMFSAFKGSPRIVRLFGTGIVHELGSPRYEELVPPAGRLPGSRAAIEVNVHKVGSVSKFTTDLPQSPLRIPFGSSHADTLYRSTSILGNERSCAMLCDLENNEMPMDVQKKSWMATADSTAYLKPTPAYPLPEDSVPEKSMRKYWAVKNIRSIDGIPGLQLGRTYAGLPMTRDEIKDNTRFHEPVGVVGSKSSKVGVVETPTRGGWAPIIAAFALGLVAAQLAGSVRHAYGLAFAL
ncbi:unnamed protein product [Rhizoctonia solani]|uniref:Pyridoxamine 5'-phosphate oxidase N-terminal domain-containing protein n=1 Tax=Rhizoctonia solani TaxID=456999 RepID=A0A8H3BTG1_9AGAM|nr:unnamed protein product [Rhizoctonia solani]